MRYLLALLLLVAAAAEARCPYDPKCINNPYGAGNPFKPNGLMNPYSQYGSQYSNKSWRNPYATDAPKLFNQDGEYRGRLSTNPLVPDSVSNPFGKYGNPYSPDSPNNPYVDPFRDLYVVPD